MDKTPIKKGRHYFETALRTDHVTFDDGVRRKSNLPWGLYLEARCDYFEKDAINVTIGEWLIILTGHNLEPLYTAIESRTLTRILAHPNFDDDEAHHDDTFVSDIRFLPAPPKPGPGQMSLEL